MKLKLDRFTVLLVAGILMILSIFTVNLWVLAITTLLFTLSCTYNAYRIIEKSNLDIDKISDLASDLAYTNWEKKGFKNKIKSVAFFLSVHMSILGIMFVALLIITMFGLAGGII